MTPRQLLVFCDGTNNTLNGGEGDTNVLRLAQRLREGPAGGAEQRVWYDPGVGAAVNLPEATLWMRFKGYLQRLWGLAFGDGVYENIEQAINFLARNHRDGDQIYLFGFSRGAFTARAVGGIINQYGLPDVDHLHLVPLLIQRYFSSANTNAPRDHRAIRQARVMVGSREPFIHFVGVWDTVDEVGLPGLGRKIRNSAALDNKCFVHVRHVVALDEHRRLFRPRLFQRPANGAHTARRGDETRQGTFKQVALPGCHSDIGGGYAASGLSDLSLRWMIDEARQCGLALAPLPPVLSTARVHSELHSAFGWALTGQWVRDARSGLTPLEPPPGMPAQPAAPVSVWQGRDGRRALWLLAALALTVAAYAWLGRVAPPGAIPLWQLTAGFSGASAPLPPDTIMEHLWRDTVAFIPALSLLMSLLTGAGFALWAGQRRPGQAPARWLNALGLALPVYLVGDLLENGFTACVLWLSATNAPCCLAAALALLMSLTAAVKWLGFVGALLLSLVGLYAQGLSWWRPRG